MKVSFEMKKVFRKLLFKSDVVFYDQEKLEDETRKELVKISKEFSTITDSNLEAIHDIHLRTAARERVITRLSEEGSYTTDKCLIVRDPYGYVPLSAIAIFSTDVPLSSKVWVDAPKNSVIKGECEAVTNHRIPIMGLFPASVNYVTIELYDKAKCVKKIRFTIETEELPEDMKRMVSIPVASGEPTSDFYHVSGVDTWFPYVFDRYGKVRYYITKPTKSYGVFPISDGMLLHPDRAVLKPSYGVPHATAIYRMDAFGRVHQTMYVNNGLHHDVVEMTKGGNLLIATNSLEGYCEDAVAEVDVKTGKIIKQLNMNDIVTEESVKDSADWAHMNTVAYDKDDNSVLVCLRNLHSVLKIDWATNELKWILGDPFFWKGTTMEKYVLRPVGDIKWFYQAHSSFQMEKKYKESSSVVKIAIYDNHCQSRRKTDNFDNDPKSYGRVYSIEENEGTVTLCKSFESVKSPIRSNLVYYPEKDRVDLMSGCLEKNKNGDQSYIYCYKYSTGELQRRYCLKAKFYRAYPYKFNFESLAKPVDLKFDIYGELDAVKKSETIDTSEAIPLPVFELSEEEALKRAQLKKDKKMRTRAEREAEWEEMMKGKVWEELDHTERIARTSFKIRGNLLYMYAVDHIVTNLYLVSENDTYEMDFTGTKQELLAIFYNYAYNIPISLDGVKAGRYNIYVKCFDTLYNTEKFIQIGE